MLFMCWMHITLQYSPLSLSQPLQSEFLCFCRLLDFGLQLHLLADDLLLLQCNLLRPLHHLNLHLLLLDALLGFGHLTREARRKEKIEQPLKSNLTLPTIWIGPSSPSKKSTHSMDLEDKIMNR